MKQNKAEIVVFVLFCVVTAFVTCFHELWFDELQAWGIAGENLSKILFVMPHFEGHPPFWHFILKLFRFFTDNPEIIRIPNLIIMYAAIGLLIFKSPFPKIVRLTLPFTYYFIYQYTIISRPYCILILGLFLAAVLHRERDEHPVKYILTLVLLSLSSVYGLILATFISLLWAVDILEKQKVPFKTFVTKDKRFFALLALFFVCIIITLLIFPDRAVTASSRFKNLYDWQRFVYFVVGIPADATVSNIFNYHSVWLNSILNAYTVIAWLFGAILLTYLIKIFIDNKRFKLLLFLYFPMVLFMYKFYVHPHHIGIITVIFIYIFWCLLLEKQGEKILPQNSKFYYLIIFTIIMGIYGGVHSLITEIYWNYSFSKDIVNYIKDKDLTKYKILIEPQSESLTVEICSYFNKNIFLNNSGGMYLKHNKRIKNNDKELYDKALEDDSADFVISPWSFYYQPPEFKEKMILMKNFHSGFIYKNGHENEEIYLYKNINSRYNEYEKQED